MKYVAYAFAAVGELIVFFWIFKCIRSALKIKVSKMRKKPLDYEGFDLPHLKRYGHEKIALDMSYLCVFAAIVEIGRLL